MVALACLIATGAAAASHSGRTTQHAIVKVYFAKHRQLYGLIVTLSAPCSDKKRRTFTPGFIAPFAHRQTKAGDVSDHYNILGRYATTGVRFRQRAGFSADVTRTRVTGTARGTLILLPSHIVCTSPTVHFTVHL
jgi:hypothetical protein